MIDLSLSVAAPEGLDLMGDPGNEGTKLSAALQLVPELGLDRVHHVHSLQPVQGNMVEQADVHLVWLGVSDTTGGGPPGGEVTSSVVTKSLKECCGAFVRLLL